MAEMDLISSDLISESGNQNGDCAYLRSEYAVSCVFQFYYVLRRIFLDLCRRPEKIRLKFTLKIFWGLFIGFLFFQITSSFPIGIENRRGLLSFLVVTVLFSSIMAVEAFISGRNLLIHECASGYYRVSAYFLAKICAELLTVHLIPLLLLNVVVYYMTGLRSGGFAIFYLIQLMLSLSASSFAVFIGATVDSVVSGQIIANVIGVIMMLAGGVFRNLDDTNAFFKALQYASIPYYGMKALYVHEFKDLTLYKYNGTEVIEILPDAGNEYLESQGISTTSDWELWKNIGGLLALCVVFSSASYIQLLRIKKLK